MLAGPLPLQPLRFEPILKELIWGGRRLGTLLAKPLGAGARYAESWELADHRDDVSRVAEGPLRGTTLRDLVRRHAPALLGPGVGPRDQFPLLVKFLDAHQVLSVQVHPDDERGRRLAGDNGKTEAWVILHAEPGSLIYAGLRPGVSCADLAGAIRSGAVEPLLHRFEPRPGDCILIPAGTIHAIGGGIVLAEIQQMSDATFRVYDWGRVGADGRPRQLHPDQALEATDFDAGPVDPVARRPEPIPGGTRERLVRCPYFALERLALEGADAASGSARAMVAVGDPERQRFTILIGLEGQAEVRHGPGGTPTPLGFGHTLLLPAALGACAIAASGTAGAVVLTCTVP
jgi:mannose-6-phosphate isomerase